MRELYKAISLLGFIFAISAGTLRAQPYTLDENGNGTYGSPIAGGPFPMPFEIASDPTGGITSTPVLIYFLEFQVVSGDLELTNEDGSVADLLRFFTPSGGQNSAVIFYSQTNGTPAGVGIPSSANPVKTSVESPITLWFPGSSIMPGFPAAPFPVWDSFQYNIKTTPTSPISVSGTNLVWHVTGTANAKFHVVASTNVSSPLSSWTWISTNQFDSSGHCVLTLPMEPDKPQRFYCLSFPVP